MSKRYLVTGGLGYVGAWVTQYLAQQGHTVFALSRSASKPDLGIPYTLVQADIQADEATLAASLPDHLDGVVHAASYNEAFEPDYPRKALLVNSLGTRTLLGALVHQAKQNASALPLFVYLSTFHVFGKRSGTITEATPAEPLADYALTHFFAEEYCRMASRVHGLPSIIIRLTNGYGAPKTPQSNKWYLLLNDLCKAAYHDGKITLRAHPDTPRDFVWLGDVAHAIHALLARPDLAGNLFCLASGKANTIGTIAQRVAQTASHILGKEIPVQFIHVEDVPAPLPLHVDNTCIKKALGMAFHDKMEQEIAELLKMSMH